MSSHTTPRVLHSGSRAFRFEAVDIASGRFLNILVLNPFGGLKSGDIIDALFMNLYTFDCYWEKAGEKRYFHISELTAPTAPLLHPKGQVLVFPTASDTYADMFQDLCKDFFPQLADNHYNPHLVAMPALSQTSET